MRLFEFSDADPLRVKLVAVTNQLKSQNEPMSTDEFLTVLNKNGISLDKSDLFDMVQKDPLVNIIADVNDDTVTFKGQEDDSVDAAVDQSQDQNEKVRQQMAHSAMK
jgi:hypothetical protein